MNIYSLATGVGIFVLFCIVVLVLLLAFIGALSLGDEKGCQPCEKAQIWRETL